MVSDAPRTSAAGRIPVPRAAVAPHALTAAAGACAAAPVILSAVRAIAARWIPAADQGIIATRAFDVFSSHSPLLGQYSQASTVSGRPLYSPGPLLYWLLALPARIGPMETLALAMGIVNAAAIVASVALARRRGGIALMLPTAAALALMCRSLSSENLHDIFNPAAAVLPLTLLIFVAWSVACGDHRLLPLAILLASFAAQCHLAYVLPAAGLLLVAGIALVLARPRLRVRWLLAAALVAVACWGAPLADQVTARHGNLGLIAGAATSRRVTVGWDAAWRSVANAVGVEPRWLRRPVSEAGALGGVSGGDYGDTRLNDVMTAPGSLATGSAVVLLVALLAVAVVSLCRRRAELAAAAAIALVLCAALAADVASTPTGALNTVGYTTWWASAAGMWSWLTVAWAVASALPLPGRARGGAPFAAVGLVAVAAAAAVATASERRDAHTPDYRPARRLIAGVDAALSPGRTVWLVQRGFVLVPIEPAIRYALRRHGVRALGTLASLRSGSWYELDHRRYSAVLSLWSNGNTPPVAPRTIVARTELSDRKGRHLITAALSPPVSRRR